MLDSGISDDKIIAVATHDHGVQSVPEARRPAAASRAGAGAGRFSSRIHKQLERENRFRWKDNSSGLRGSERGRKSSQAIPGSVPEGEELGAAAAIEPGPESFSRRFFRPGLLGYQCAIIRARRRLQEDLRAEARLLKAIKGGLLER